MSVRVLHQGHESSRASKTLMRVHDVVAVSTVAQNMANYTKRGVPAVTLPGNSESV